MEITGKGQNQTSSRTGNHIQEGARQRIISSSLVEKLLDKMNVHGAIKTNLWQLIIIELILTALVVKKL